MIYNRKYVFGLHPHFWQRAPKTVGTSYVMNIVKVSFVMLLGGFVEVESIANDLINHNYVMKPPKKPKRMGF